jgi:hypothetical protein
MKWSDIVEQIQQIIKAHPDLPQEDYARMVQQQFRDQPILGWLLLDITGYPLAEEHHEEPHE